MGVLDLPDDTRGGFCVDAGRPLRVRLSVLSARRLHRRMTLHGSSGISCYQERSVWVSVYKAEALSHLN
jgi:hypothetical protein